MNETLDPQQNVREDLQYVDIVHDAIANNELGREYNFTRLQSEDVVDTQPGRVDDVNKAHEMALAAKPGIDKVLAKVALRDHDLSPLQATITLPDGKKYGLPHPDGARLVTKPHRTEVLDDKGQPTGKTGIRTETHRYSDLRQAVHKANRAAMKAGEDYDRRNQ